MPIALWAVRRHTAPLCYGRPVNPNSRTFPDPTPLSLPLCFLSALICPVTIKAKNKNANKINKWHQEGTEFDSLTSSQVIITFMMLKMSRNNCSVKLKAVQLHFYCNMIYCNINYMQTYLLTGITEQKNTKRYSKAILKKHSPDTNS